MGPGPLAFAAALDPALADSLASAALDPAEELGSTNSNTGAPALVSASESRSTKSNAALAEELGSTKSRPDDSDSVSTRGNSVEDEEDEDDEEEPAEASTPRAAEGEE